MSAQRINLLPQDEFGQTTLGRVLNWALSAGRIIVIVTELVVILAFLSRFFLDVQITNLNESIAAKSTQIESTSEFEQSFRLAQRKIQIYNLLKNKGIKTSIYQNVSNQVPAGVRLTNTTFKQNEVEIKGVASSEQQIQVFIKLLDRLPEISDIKVSQAVLSSEVQTETAAIAFTLKASTKGESTKNGI